MYYDLCRTIKKSVLTFVLVLSLHVPRANLQTGLCFQKHEVRQFAKKKHDDTMPRTRRSEKGKRKTLEASDIKSFDTCIDIDLPRDLCCDKCQVTIDQINNLTKKPSVKKKRFRDYAEDSVNRCKQPWASRNGND